MNMSEIMQWLRKNEPWLFKRGSASLTETEVEKIVAVIDAREAVLAEQRERIHEEAMEAISDPYGDNE